MDIQTEYQDRLMKKKVPGLSEYLSTRKCNNKTGKPYSAEPLDKRHEEFNRRGLNLQIVRSLDDFTQNFKICDVYLDMKEACLKENGLSDGKVESCKALKSISIRSDLFMISLPGGRFQMLKFCSVNKDKFSSQNFFSVFVRRLRNYITSYEVSRSVAISVQRCSTASLVRDWLDWAGLKHSLIYLLF